MNLNQTSLSDSKLLPTILMGFVVGIVMHVLPLIAPVIIFAWTGGQSFFVGGILVLAVIAIGFSLVKKLLRPKPQVVLFAMLCSLGVLFISPKVYDFDRVMGLSFFVAGIGPGLACGVFYWISKKSAMSPAAGLFILGAIAAIVNVGYIYFETLLVAH